MDAAPLPVAGRYHFVRRLPTTGRGLVWLAQDEATGRALVASLLPRRRLRGLEPIVGLSHPHMAQLIDIVEDWTPEELPKGDAAHTDGGIALSQYVSGRTLHQRLQKGPIDPIRAAQWIERLADLLATLHRMSAFHGAVSPRAIVVARTTHGVAPVLTHLLMPPVGSYCSPERVTGGGPSAADDVWALCATLYTALAGKPPFSGVNRQELAKAILAGDPPGMATVDTELVEIARSGLRQQPSVRWRVAAAPDAALKAWLRERKVDTREDLRTMFPSDAPMPSAPPPSADDQALEDALSHPDSVSALMPVSYIPPGDAGAARPSLSDLAAAVGKEPEAPPAASSRRREASSGAPISAAPSSNASDAPDADRTAAADAPPPAHADAADAPASDAGEPTAESSPASSPPPSAPPPSAAADSPPDETKSPPPAQASTPPSGAPQSQRSLSPDDGPPRRLSAYEIALQRPPPSPPPPQPPTHEAGDGSRATLVVLGLMAAALVAMLAAFMRPSVETAVGEEPRRAHAKAEPAGAGAHATRAPEVPHPARPPVPSPPSTANAAVLAPATASAAPSPATPSATAPPPSTATPSPGAAAGDPTACLVGVMPEGTFGDDPSLEFVCDETEMWGLTRKIFSRVSKRGRGDGMEMWVYLTRYELPAIAMLRARCCPSADPFTAATPKTSCGSLDDVLEQIAQAPTDANVARFEELFECLKQRKVRYSPTWDRIPARTSREHFDEFRALFR